MKKNRAFLKWAGGKYTLVEDICRYLPIEKRLIEPFIGAGSIFLNTNYEEYLLADINADLINLYNIVKNQPDHFTRDAKLMFTGEFNNSNFFYELRTEFNQSVNPYRKAILFLYLNRHCYNGLCRYNLRGEFNVPFGLYKKPYFPESELYCFAQKAQKATFVCEHYIKSMSQVEEGTVVYCDPPYTPISITSNFTAYYTKKFSIKDQVKLAEVALKLSLQQKIPVLISNHDTALTRQWYAQAELFVVRVCRNISSKADGRNKLNELLALYL